MVDLKVVADNTEEEITANTDREEGWMYGQSQAFIVGKKFQDNLLTTTSSTAYQAAAIAGYLAYNARLYMEMSKQAEMLADEPGTLQ